MIGPWLHRDSINRKDVGFVGCFIVIVRICSDLSILVPIPLTVDSQGRRRDIIDSLYVSGAPLVLGLFAVSGNVFIFKNVHIYVKTSLTNLCPFSDSIVSRVP